MALEGIMLGEVSQTEREKTLCGLTYMWNLKKTHKNQICGYQSRG